MTIIMDNLRDSSFHFVSFRITVKMVRGKIGCHSEGACD